MHKLSLVHALQPSCFLFPQPLSITNHGKIHQMKVWLNNFSVHHGTIASIVRYGQTCLHLHSPRSTWMEDKAAQAKRWPALCTWNNNLSYLLQEAEIKNGKILTQVFLIWVALQRKGKEREIDISLFSPVFGAISWAQASLSRRGLWVKTNHQEPR